VLKSFSTLRGSAPSSAQRHLRLAEVTKTVLEDHDLRGGLSETVCLPCTGFDIAPHQIFDLEEPMKAITGKLIA